MTPATSDLHNALKSRRLAWQKFLNVQVALDFSIFKLIQKSAAMDSYSANERLDERVVDKFH